MYTAPRIAITCMRSESDAATRIEIAFASALTRAGCFQLPNPSPDRVDIVRKVECISAPKLMRPVCKADISKKLPRETGKRSEAQPSHQTRSLFRRLKRVNVGQMVPRRI